MDPDFVLLSCTYNLYEKPQPSFVAEQVPVEAPAYVRDAELCDNDLFFLRWVFENHFHLLTSYITQNFPQYCIHLARPEPDVSWESYRCKERGFLIWLVKSQEFRNDPVCILKAALSFYKNKEAKKIGTAAVASESDKKELSSIVEKTGDLQLESTVSEPTEPTGPVKPKDTADINNKENSEFTGSDESQVAELVAQQLDLVRSNIRKCFQELQEVESLVNEIWALNKESKIPEQPKVSKESKLQEEALPVKTGGDWCVVDDEYSAVLKPNKPSGLLAKVKQQASKFGSL